LCRDGWGIGWYDGPTGKWDKSGEDVMNVGQRFFETVERAKGNVIVAHVRLSTGGAVDTCNSHPFPIPALGRDWLFAHNGSVPQIVCQDYPSRVKDSDIDSARIFSFLVDEMERYIQGSTIRGIYPAVVRATRTLIERFEGDVNYLLTDGACLFILNHYPGKPIYFTKRDKPYGSAFVATTVCKLTNERWRALPPDRVLAVSNGDFLVLSDPIV
jgi:glutamine amidotransferase